MSLYMTIKEWKMLDRFVKRKFGLVSVPEIIENKASYLRTKIREADLLIGANANSHCYLMFVSFTKNITAVSDYYITIDDWETLHDIYEDDSVAVVFTDYEKASNFIRIVNKLIRSLDPDGNDEITFMELHMPYIVKSLNNKFCKHHD